MKKLNKKNSLNSNRSFGLLFFIIFFLYGIWPLIDSSNIRSWSLILSLVFLILGIINSKILTPFKNSWIKLGELLGRFIAPIVMGILYFMVITPIGITLNLFGKDILRKKFNSKPSYWIKRDKKVGPMKKQF
tara:strand:+ start:228 stop:623 length:396 start_codon:yes stop_codon:yes gene_type:complete